MIEAIDPQPGDIVLELAAGPGETGFLAAELVHPGGRLISSDFAAPMVEVARERAGELGLRNVEFRRLDAESLDLDAASVDGVLCRFGYMLMADPEAALRETRRVLRPRRRVALAAWGEPADNPWVTLIGQEVRRLTGAPEPDPAAPGMFAFAAPGRAERLLDDAGFTEVAVESPKMHFEWDSFDEWWEVTFDLSRPLADLVAGLEPAERDRLRAETERRMAEFAGADGGLRLPARPILAAATA
jgi:ubiquinone/menaquinone biosynthesis C-methylase UbiE